MSESHQSDPIQGEIVHEYDGILEADNQLPRWWLATFFGAIVFSVLYWFTYESWGFLDNPREEYAAAMAAAAEAGGEVTDEMLGLIADDGSRVSEGQAAFATNCAACHGQRGEGQIGPNLTDPQWIHGGAPSSIYSTVRDGVPSAGMPAWGSVLGERSVQSVVAYLMSIRDTNVPGREPQGEVWVPGAAAPAGAGEGAAAVEAGEGAAAVEAGEGAAPEADEGAAAVEAGEGAAAPEGVADPAAPPEASPTPGVTAEEPGTSAAAGPAPSDAPAI